MTPRQEAPPTLFDALPLAVIAFDSTGGIGLWNHGAERLLGWTQAEALSGSLPAVSRLLLEVSGEAKLRLHRKDGAAIIVQVWTASWPDPGGSGKLAVVSAGNIAQLTLAEVEDELQRMTAREKEAKHEARTERRFRELLEAAPDAIIEVDRDGRIMLLNLVTEKLFGYSREEKLCPT